MAEDMNIDMECRHTFLGTLSNELFGVYYSYKEAKEIYDSLVMKYTIEDMVRHRFIIDNYYHWTIVGDKDIKVQINKYHNLVEDLKAENITLPDEFVSKLLIDKLLESCINYKQQLKHRHKQMNRQKINDNPYKPEANLAEADGIIVVVISQECEQMGGKL
ncbi:hypothetical protein JHK85_001173 [Glycine max]|uniref:Uncharacterized protein n=1 Tax=Glycine max TaxID=3847 RepID=A0A0R0L900_SOYBN|nr:hypothetical protein JHK85_001173 [Glycine max]KAG5088528.1 hypothetical protein JHK86_001140 [Glycine max]